MDKYTYNIKADKIQKLVKKSDFEAAVKIADTVDWEEVHSVRLLTITAAAYENVKDYKSAIELLQLAYEESAVGKRILYKLTGLAIAEGDVELAQHYYEMYLQEASDDNGRYLLRYLLAELKKEPLDKRIAILETYRKYEFEEEWALRLAQMYDEAGMADECVKLCDEIVLWFGVGDYVDEALALKEKYAPLSAEQQDHRDNKEFYEQRYQEVVEEYTDRDAAPEPENDAPDAAENEAAAPEEWPEQIMLVEADNLDEAVPRTLEKMADYYRSKKLPMGKLTRISAERFNQVGFEAARVHTQGKDLLIDNASSLSEDLLADIVHSVKYEKNDQLFIFADNPTQLAYLNARLGEFVASDTVIPQIQMTEVREDEILLHVTAAVEDELSGQEKDEEEKTLPVSDSLEETDTAAEEAEGKEEAAEEPAPEEEKSEEAPVKLEDLDNKEAEQLEFSFDSLLPAAEQDWAVAAGAVLTTELPKLDEEMLEADQGEVPEEKNKTPENEIEEAAEPEAKSETPENSEIKADEPEEPEEKTLLPETPEVQAAAAEEAEEKSGAPDIFEVKEEAPEEVAITAEVPENKESAPEEPEEEPLTSETSEMQEDRPEEPNVTAEAPEAEEEEPKEEAQAPQWSFTDFLGDQKAALKATEPKKEEAPRTESAWKPFVGSFSSVLGEPAFEEEQKPAPKAEKISTTKKVPVEEVVAELKKEAMSAKEREKLEADATTVISNIKEDIRKAAPEKEEKSLEGATKVVPKISTATGSIGAIGMSEAAFVEYAKNYLASIDCVLDDVGELALQNAADNRKENGVLLTKEEAENMIEDAADLAERKGGLFVKRYNKEGFLIIRGKYIH